LHLIESQRVTTASRTALLLGRVLRDVVVLVAPAVLGWVSGVRRFRRESS
jgi:hypothetical protein